MSANCICSFGQDFPAFPGDLLVSLILERIEVARVLQKRFVQDTVTEKGLIAGTCSSCNQCSTAGLETFASRLEAIAGKRCLQFF